MIIKRKKQPSSKIVAPFNNPHFWVVIFMTVVIILIYQVWPWREWQFVGGFWKHFSWLSALDMLVINVELRYRLFGFLFLIPIVYGSLMLSWQGGILAWALSLIWVLPTLFKWRTDFAAINLALLLLPALIVALITLERRRRANEKKLFLEREQERQKYISELITAQENERHRIAQEIHDQTIQDLIVIANKAAFLASRVEDSDLKKDNLWIKEALLEKIDDLRKLSLKLRPSILDNFGLVSGIKWLVNNSSNRSEVNIDFLLKGEERSLSQLIEVTVFRVVQESINNIIRHAKADRAVIKLEFAEKNLSLFIQDNGVGFDLPPRLTFFANEKKLGLIGIEHRILSVGGELKLDSAPGKGTTLYATFPYQTEKETL